jgi:hypothetical protein
MTAMRLEFTKMHGLGNDFMVIDLVSQRVRLEARADPPDSPTVISAWGLTSCWW